MTTFDTFDKALAVLCAVTVGLILGSGLHACGYSAGQAVGRQQASDDYKNECGCGASRQCIAGPGLVGTQRCHDAGLKNEWGMCEDIHIPW